MTETQTHGRTAKRDLRRHVLALVLFAVLVWYTVVSPSYTAAPLRAAEGDPSDAEKLGAEAHASGDFATPGAARGIAPLTDEFRMIGEEAELDWPEIIDLD